MQKNDDPIIIEQTFNASIDTVWSAITKVDQMVQWYFAEIPSFAPEVGFETRFNVQVEDRNFPHLWKVTEVIPQRLITYRWNYEGYPGEFSSTFELSEQDNRTTLTLTSQVHESFPQNIPEFKRESGVAGWTYFIKESLKAFLEKSS